jgi:hypothetical protein
MPTVPLLATLTLKLLPGLNLGVNYKNFDASIFLYGSFGNKIMEQRKILERLLRFIWHR